MPTIHLSCPQCEAKFTLDRLPVPGASITCEACKHVFAFNLSKMGERSINSPPPVDEDPPPPAVLTQPADKPLPMPPQPVKTPPELAAPVLGPAVDRPRSQDISQVVLLGSFALVLMSMVALTAMTLGIWRSANAVAKGEPKAAPPAPTSPPVASVNPPTPPPTPVAPPPVASVTPTPPPMPMPPPPTPPPVATNANRGAAVGLVCAIDNSAEKQSYMPYTMAWVVGPKWVVTRASKLIKIGDGRVLEVVFSDRSRRVISTTYHAQFPKDAVDRKDNPPEVLNRMLLYDVALLELDGELPAQLALAENTSLKQIPDSGRPIEIFGFGSVESFVPMTYRSQVAKLGGRLIPMGGGKEKYDDCSGIDAKLAWYSDGGPVFDLDGQVLGLLVVFIDREEKLTGQLVLSAQRVRELLRALPNAGG